MIAQISKLALITIIITMLTINAIINTDTNQLNENVYIHKSKQCIKYKQMKMWAINK